MSRSAAGESAERILFTHIAVPVMTRLGSPSARCSTAPRYPFQLGTGEAALDELMAQRAAGLHQSGKKNETLINPKDAAALGIVNGDRVRVFSRIGAVELVAAISDRPRRGLVAG